MGRLDEIKGEIDWLGRWLNVLIVATFALIGWLVLNYETQKPWIVYTALIIVILFSFAIAIINGKAINKIKEMRKLK